MRIATVMPCKSPRAMGSHGRALFKHCKKKSFLGFDRSTFLSTRPSCFCTACSDLTDGRDAIRWCTQGAACIATFAMLALELLCTRFVAQLQLISSLIDSRRFLSASWVKLGLGPCAPCQRRARLHHTWQCLWVAFARCKDCRAVEL